jgi:hypothetical protein
MSLFSLDEESEKHILFSHLQRKVRYLFGKWMSLLLVVIPLLLFAILFPIITNSFKGSMTIGICILVICSHVIFSALGILVGTFCSATKLAAKKYGWLSAVLVLVVSLSIKSLLEMTAYFKWITWVFPPVFKVIDHMGGGEVIQNQDSLVSDGIFVSIYLLIGTLVMVYLFRKNES